MSEDDWQYTEEPVTPEALAHWYSPEGVNTLARALASERARADTAEREVARLRNALIPYADCRHGQLDCFCTTESRAALAAGEQPGQETISVMRP